MPTAAVSAGFAAPGFAGVRELFDSFLSEDPGYSAQLSAYHHGTKVLDLCGGPGFVPGDITGTYSCSKGVAAFVIALLVQDGRLDLDRTVASYWPEFGVHGKDRLTVRHPLTLPTRCNACWGSSWKRCARRISARHRTPIPRYAH